MSPFHGPLTQVARIFKSSTNKDGRPLIPSNRALLIVCAIVALVFATMWLLYLRFGYRGDAARVLSRKRDRHSVRYYLLEFVRNRRDRGFDNRRQRTYRGRLDVLFIRCMRSNLL